MRSPPTAEDIFSPEVAAHIYSPPINESAAVLKEAKSWLAPTVEQVRNRVLIGMILLVADEEMPRQTADMLAAVLDLTVEVLNAGRLFDLGDMPNAVIVPESKRAGPLWTAGYINHPFREPYLLFHRWEGGGSLYFIDPATTFRRPDMPDTVCLIVEFQTMVSRALQFLLCSAAVLLWPAPDNPDKNQGEVTYSIAGTEALLGSREAQTQVFCSCVDPMVAGMLLLNTEGIAVDRIEPSAALNKARLKSGKEPLPGHYRVATADYVTAITGRRQRGGDGQGGHHASPMPHLRRGHLRHKHEMHGGGTVWVRDALVLIKDGVELPPGRAFYRVQTEKGKKT